MPPVVDPTPSTTASPLSGRRLISRLKSPFGAKARNVTDFYVEVDNPHKQYSPGETVHGSVHLRVVKPTRVTHLVVCLHGFVQVYKNPGSPPSEGYRGNGSGLGTGRSGNRSGEYFGNGFASLFEDEVVLCGDGRLGEGVYLFKFDLEFPDRDLPSSISFERGTISYMVTATLTRPTTMSPTIQCDTKVYLVERIDISRYYPPKARTITLEALSRKTRARRKLGDTSDRLFRKGDAKRDSEEPGGSRSPSPRSLHPNAGLPQSPSPSAISSESAVSGHGPPLHWDSHGHSPRQSDASKTDDSKGSLDVKTITATVESLAGGCLRGDSIPIRVTVNHRKYVKSLYGVIITLYRQARVDMHPAIPLGPTEKGKGSKYEDYYPKSFSGLGGLSLSGAGSSHIFRKDLSQVMLPLIVNPQTHFAEVNGRVHVPDEAFPTISTVPGGMISFKYYVEVLVDVQGKLSSQDRNLGNLGGLTSTIGGSGFPDGMDAQRSAGNPFGSPVVDTTPIRRDKGVVACTFEVIVGTKDSERRKGKRKVEADAVQPSPQSVEPRVQPQQQQASAGAEAEAYGTNHHWSNVPPDQSYDQYWYGHEPYSDYSGYGYGYEYGQPAHYDLFPSIPLPQLEDESQLPEKERLRRAEARLLPSQPPGAEDDTGDSSSAPNAPYLPEEDPLTEYNMASSSRAGVATPPIPHASSSHHPLTPTHHHPKTPAYSPPEASAASDDKRDLERRRLEAEASAPPDDDDEDDDTRAGAEEGPSAPVLDEHEELSGFRDDGRAGSEAGLGLPRYER